MPPQTPPTPLIFEVTTVTNKLNFSAITEVEDQAFRVSVVMMLMFPPNPDSLPEEAFNLSVANHQNCRSTDPTARYLKATLPSGKIIGMAKWNFFLDPSSGPQYPWSYLKFPSNSNKELCEYYFSSIDDARNNAMAGKKHFLMADLTVLPEFQRMGVGRKLLEWGLKQADAEEVETWIDASPQGLGLYKKMGWEEISFVDIDLGRWGGEKGKVRRTVGLVRPPAAQGGVR